MASTARAMEAAEPLDATMMIHRMDVMIAMVPDDGEEVAEDEVRVMTNVYIPSRTWLGSHVFIGPGVNFLNDRFPYRRDPMPTPRGATIEDDLMVGGGVTILPEITIG